jgi:hypothetical protein
MRCGDEFPRRRGRTFHVQRHVVLDAGGAQRPACKPVRVVSGHRVQRFVLLLGRRLDAQALHGLERLHGAVHRHGCAAGLLCGGRDVVPGQQLPPAGHHNGCRRRDHYRSRTDHHRRHNRPPHNHGSDNYRFRADDDKGRNDDCSGRNDHCCRWRDDDCCQWRNDHCCRGRDHDCCRGRDNNGCRRSDHHCRRWRDYDSRGADNDCRSDDGCRRGRHNDCGRWRRNHDCGRRRRHHDRGRWHHDDGFRRQCDHDAGSGNGGDGGPAGGAAGGGPGLVLKLNRGPLLVKMKSPRPSALPSRDTEDPLVAVIQVRDEQGTLGEELRAAVGSILSDVPLEGETVVSSVAVRCVPEGQASVPNLVVHWHRRPVAVFLLACGDVEELKERHLKTVTRWMEEAETRQLEWVVVVSEGAARGRGRSAWEKVRGEARGRHEEQVVLWEAGLGEAVLPALRRALGATLARGLRDLREHVRGLETRRGTEGWNCAQHAVAQEGLAIVLERARHAKEAMAA